MRIHPFLGLGFALVWGLSNECGFSNCVLEAWIESCLIYIVRAMFGPDSDFGLKLAHIVLAATFFYYYMWPMFGIRLSVTSCKVLLECVYLAADGFGEIIENGRRGGPCYHVS